ncbi:mgpp2cl-1, protein phosphatase 2C-like protein 1 [Rhodotorula toruloides]
MKGDDPFGLTPVHTTPDVPAIPPLHTRRSGSSLSPLAKDGSGSPPNLRIDVDAVNATTSPAPEEAGGPGFIPSTSSSSSSSSSRPAAVGAKMSDPDARTVDQTEAEGKETYGRLNQHPKRGENEECGFKVGVSVDRNKKCRRVMEDAHSFVYDFGGIRGQGYFAVFDGHAGKHAAEWCGYHFHEHLLDNLRKAPATPVPDLLNATFHTVDQKLSELAAQDGTHSGCTAVTCFLRLEEDDGQPAGEASGVSGEVVEVREGEKVEADAEGALKAARGETQQLTDESDRGLAGEGGVSAKEGGLGARTASDVKNKIKNMLKGHSSGNSFHNESALSTSAGNTPQSSANPSPTSTQSTQSSVATPDVSISKPAVKKKAAKRTLYTANVGDARAVLSRGGKAVRLTYDHKGSDTREAKRISDAGGFVLNNRVNGVLAVTRSLGDSSMKEFVVGAPFTTETTLGPEDDYLIVACDGLWDVCSDQEAVDLIHDLDDPQEASQKLLDHALSQFSSDNLSILVVRTKLGVVRTKLGASAAKVDGFVGETPESDSSA